MEIEKRYFKTELQKFEAREEEREVVIEGYAAVFNQEISMSWGKEKIIPGAFTRTLEERPDVLALFDHQTNAVIGRASAGTLLLKQDGYGLKIRLIPPQTQLGRDVMELVKTRHIRSMSFGFIVEKERFEKGNVRAITDVTLYEVSLVSFPAYDGTSANVFSSSSQMEARSIEKRIKRVEGYRNRLARISKLI